MSDYFHVVSLSLSDMLLRGCFVLRVSVDLLFHDHIWRPSSEH